MKDFDQYGGNNVLRYTKLFESMSDKTFHSYMESIRDKKIQLDVIIPNGTDKLTTNNLVDLAKRRNVQLFSRVFMYDPHTNRKYLTKYPMMVITVPIRRLSQYLFHKISLPDSDTHINPITGQVFSPDKGAALSAIETHVLASKNLSTSIVELIKLRAGDLNAYRTMKYTIEENGRVSLDEIPMTNQPRSVVTARNYFHGMMIDITL